MAKKKEKEAPVKYKSGIAHTGEIDGQDYKEYSYDYVSASIDCHKRYHNVICILFRIDGCERNLIDWITSNMGEEGYINNNEITRAKFIDFHKKYKQSTNKVYKDPTVNAAFNNLQKVNLLIRRGKGTYQVNPLYFSTKSEKDRAISIRLVMEFTAGLDTSIKTDGL